jgi:hypothetical protein
LFYKATVIAGVRPDMAAYKNEIFGPVAPVTIFDDEDEAVALVLPLGEGGRRRRGPGMPRSWSAKSACRRRLDHAEDPHSEYQRALDDDRSEGCGHHSEDGQGEHWGLEKVVASFEKDGHAAQSIAARLTRA